jgi:hypothetical protein
LPFISIEVLRREPNVPPVLNIGDPAGICKIIDVPERALNELGHGPRGKPEKSVL